MLGIFRSSIKAVELTTSLVNLLVLCVRLLQFSGEKKNILGYIYEYNRYLVPFGCQETALIKSGIR